MPKDAVDAGQHSARPCAVTWLGHSTVVLDLGTLRLITDPLLRAHAPPLRRRFPAPDPRTWRGTRAVLLSHLHHVHAELASLRLLADVPVLTAEANATWLRRRNLTGVGLGEDWTTVESGAHAVEVRLVHAEHHSRPMPHRPNAANGHLVRAGSLRIHVAGDTSLFPGLADVPEALGAPADLIVVPIGGWGPRLSPGHLGPDEAARACALTGARRALAVHWGTLHPPMLAGRPAERTRLAGWLDAPLPSFAAALAREAPDCELLDLRPGQTHAL